MAINKTSLFKFIIVSVLSFTVATPNLFAMTGHDSHTHEEAHSDHHYQSHHDNIDDSQSSHNHSHTHKHSEDGEEHDHNHSHHSHIDLTTKTLFLSRTEFRLIEIVSSSGLSESIMISDPHPSSIFRPPIESARISS